MGNYQAWKSDACACVLCYDPITFEVVDHITTKTGEIIKTEWCEFCKKASMTVQDTIAHCAGFSLKHGSYPTKEQQNEIDQEKALEKLESKKKTNRHSRLKDFNKKEYDKIKSHMSESK